MRGTNLLDKRQYDENLVLLSTGYVLAWHREQRVSLRAARPFVRELLYLFRPRKTNTKADERLYMENPGAPGQPCGRQTKVGSLHI